MRMSSMAAAAAATVVFGGVACGVASAAPPKCSDVPGTLVGRTCQVQLTDPGYAVSISFPADFPDQKAVQEYVKQTRDGFLNVARGGEARTAPYALEIKSTEYSAAVPPRGTQSLVLEVYESVGGAHPTTFYKAFNWDQGYRKPITIETLFADGVDPYPVILPLVQEAVTKQFGDEVAFPATADPTVFANFALTNDELIFFFDRGAVLPDAVGPVEVGIPRETVNPLLA